MCSYCVYRSGVIVTIGFIFQEFETAFIVYTTMQVERLAALLLAASYSRPFQFTISTSLKKLQKNGFI